jgi:hypothetical protein
MCFEERGGWSYFILILFVFGWRRLRVKPFPEANISSICRMWLLSPDPTARERHGFSFFAHVSSKLSSLIFPQVRRHLVQAAVRHSGSIARRHLALPHWRCQSFSHPPPPPSHFTHRQDATQPNSFALLCAQGKPMLRLIAAFTRGHPWLYFRLILSANLRVHFKLIHSSLLHEHCFFEGDRGLKDFCQGLR